MIQRRQLLKTLVAASLFRTIGRDRIAARIAELNAAFRDGAARIPGVTLHTPRDPNLSAGISCFEVRGMAVAEVVARLAAKKIRTPPPRRTRSRTRALRRGS
ncbi:MAG TPA: hypothetical protein VEK83_01300 [Gemmatimonadales bacterium]|nr:hypothetical protein [Gemmatimonadales bacterium]